MQPSKRGPIIAALGVVLLVLYVLTPHKPSAGPPNMLGGFKAVDNASNDEGVEKARAAAEAHWAAKHGALAEPLTVVSVQKQVVAGTNYKLSLQAGAKTFEATVWEKLPAHGGAFEVTAMKETQSAGGDGAADEFPDNPEVDDAAAYAVQVLNEQSNSLYPMTLKKVLSARVAKSGEGGGVTHLLTLQLSHGSMPDSVYEVEVANPGGSYALKNSRQVKHD